MQNAWAFARSPTNQIPMFMFMMWMMGNNLSIYTIMFSMQLVTTPFKAIFSLNESFQ